MTTTVNTYTVSPIPIKRRVRFQKSGYPYIDAATKADMQRVADAYTGAYYATEPLALIVDVFEQLPVGRINKGSEPFTLKPDIDNVIKCVMDGLNGKAYADDKQIVYVSGWKHPRTSRRIGEFVAFSLMPYEIYKQKRKVRDAEETA